MIIQGDALTVLREQFADQSVQCCVTSPPYWGLRDYGTGTWEGGNPSCDHAAPLSGGKTKGTGLVGTGNRGGFSADGQYRRSCPKCGARRIDHQIGLEATPDAYVARLVKVFREVRRVLKDDGVLFLNLGDSYASSSTNPSQSLAGSRVPSCDNDDRARRDSTVTDSGGECRAVLSNHRHKSRKDASGMAWLNYTLKPKDLVGIPWMVAFALRQDGWYLRSDIIWSKPNPMPESVTDRPTKAHEYMFLLSKRERYYYDAEAIAEAGVGRETYCGSDAYSKGSGRNDSGSYDSTSCNTRNKRTVWTVSTQPYREAHFATFPPKLVEPCILAGCPSGGLVLDPFAGSGTTLHVAQQLGRRGVGIELNADYITLAERRCAQKGLAL